MNELVFEPNLVPFPNANECRALRASTGICLTMHDKSGISKVASQILENIVEHSRSSEQPWTINTDTLDGDALSQKVIDSIVGSEEINELPEDDLESRSRLLNQLATEAATSFYRMVRTRIEDEIDAAVTPVRKTLQEQTQNSPFAATERLTEFIDAISAIRFGKKTREETRKFLNLKRAKSVFTTPGVLPEKIRTRLMPKFQRIVREGFFDALAEEIQFLILPKLKNELREIEILCEESRQIASQTRTAIDQLHRQFRLESISAKHETVVPKNSIFLELPSLESTEIVAGLKASFRCKDQVALTKALADNLQEQLNQYAQKNQLTKAIPAQLPELLSRIPAEVVIAELHRMISDAIGEHLSIYRAIRDFGVTEFSQTLVNKSETISRLGANEKEELNVSATYLFRGFLPPPVGEEDAATRAELENDLTFYLPGISFVELGPNETQITLIQMNCFFPICIEEHNEDLLLMYQQSVQHDHLPHLIGFHDSSDGTHVDDALKLAELLFGEN